MPQILIADDEASIRTILSKAMEKKGLEIIRAQNGNEALLYLKTRPVDIAIIDIRMPEVSGLDILDHQKEFASHPLIFVITAQDTMQNAIEAMKRGAYDYLTKPFDLEELSLLVDRALETRRLRNEVQMLQETKVRGKKSGLVIIGKSKAIQEIYKIIGRVANQDVTILIQGESGTGKELVAKAIHYQGRRAPYPFVAVNCSAIPANLLESELFGYKKGAFTGAIADRVGYFERAHLGTLFLDEIADMPLELQAKLLRVIQEKEVQRLGDTKTILVDFRLIAATNQILETRVKKGLFREDLYFRLNVVPIFLPPLRERKADFRHLVDYFLEEFTSEFGGDLKKISKEAFEYLQNKPWPGNIRELENILKRVFVLTSGPILEKRSFESLETAFQSPMLTPTLDMENFEIFITKGLEHFFKRLSSKDSGQVYDRFIAFMERPLIRLALQTTKGNQLQAAHLLGMNRNTLRKKIRELKVERRGLIKRTIL